MNVEILFLYGIYYNQQVIHFYTILIYDCYKINNNNNIKKIVLYFK